MAIIKEKKINIISEYRINESDTGSEQLQVALLTANISNLTVHLQKNKKDYSSKHGLFKMISRRRKFLKYLESKNKGQYKELIKRLGLKK